MATLVAADTTEEAVRQYYVKGDSWLLDVTSIHCKALLLLFHHLKLDLQRRESRELTNADVLTYMLAAAEVKVTQTSHSAVITAEKSVDTSDIPTIELAPSTLPLASVAADASLPVPTSHIPAPSHSHISVESSVNSEYCADLFSPPIVAMPPTEDHPIPTSPTPLFRLLTTKAPPSLARPPEEVIPTSEANESMDTSSQQYASSDSTPDGVRFVSATDDDFQYKEGFSLEPIMFPANSPEEKFGCPLCSYRSRTRKNVARHALSHSDYRAHKCPLCDYRAKHRHHLHAHVTRAHFLSHTEATVLLRPPRQPKREAEKGSTPDRSSSLSAEEKLPPGHFGSERNPKVAAAEPMIVETGDPHKPYGCSECPYRAFTVISMRRHSLTHTNERPHQCPLCSYRAKHRHHLSDHLMRHNGARKFSCPHCYRRFIRTTELHRHILRCTGTTQEPTASLPPSEISEDLVQIKAERMDLTFNAATSNDPGVSTLGDEDDFPNEGQLSRTMLASAEANLFIGSSLPTQDHFGLEAIS